MSKLKVIVEASGSLPSDELNDQRSATDIFDLEFHSKYLMEPAEVLSLELSGSNVADGCA